MVRQSERNEHNRSICRASVLLKQWADGNDQAFNELFVMFHDDLKQLSHHILAREKAGHILQTTALVNELYMKWYAAKRVVAEDQKTFKRFAARAMRQILVDYARKKRLKTVQEEPECREKTRSHFKSDPELHLACDRAIEKLTERFPVRGFIVTLKVVVGLPLNDIAKTLDLPYGTVKREWLQGKKFISDELKVYQ